MATTHGKPYFRFSKSLKDLNLPFDSILPEDILNYSGNLILTTENEAPKDCKTPMLHEEAFNNNLTVIKGIMIQKLNLRFDEDHLVIGVDPGQTIGLSVFYYGQEIESSLYSSVNNLVEQLISILGGLRAKRKIVKIGNGNMPIAKEISKLLNLRFCSSYELEFVDERKTSLKIKNYNQRGKRDMLSAKYISQREGYTHVILPLSMTG